jgi:hypothetical protein
MSDEGEEAFIDACWEVSGMQHCVWIERVDEHGFRVRFETKKLPIEYQEMIPEFISLHRDRLRALLDKPVILHVTWNDGYDRARVSVMPADHVPKEQRIPVQSFTVPFPEQEPIEQPARVN